GRPEPLSPLLRRYAALLGLVALATLITPYGWRLLALPFSITGSSTYAKLIVEWGAPGTSRLWLHRHVALVFGVPLAVGLWLRRNERDALPWVFGLAVGWLATRALRHNTVWALTAWVLLAETWGPLANRW